MVDLLAEFEKVLDGFTEGLRHKLVGGGIRSIEDEPTPEEYGPIVAYLIENGYLSDPRAPEASKQLIERQLENVPESAMEAAERAARGVSAQRMQYREFLSVGLNKCGSDQETFSALTDLWSEEKDLIRGMTKAELRRELECP